MENKELQQEETERLRDEEKNVRFNANCEKLRATHKSTEGMSYSERLKAHNNVFRR